jgi:hypothetical protein
MKAPEWSTEENMDTLDGFVDIMNEYMEELEYVVHYVEILKLVLAVYPLIIVLRLFKAFAAQPRLALVTNTLAVTGVDLLHFMLVFAAMFITLAISGVVLFGRRLESFVTFPRAVNAVFRLMLGDFDWNDIRTVGQAEGAAWLFIALGVMNLLLLNMVLAIVLDGYTEVKKGSLSADPLWTDIYNIANRWWGVQRGTDVHLKVVRDALIELDKDFRGKKKLKDIMSQRDLAHARGDIAVEDQILLGRDTMAVPGMRVLPVDGDIAAFVGPGKVAEVGHLVCVVLHEDGSIQKYNTGYDLSYELKYLDGGMKPEELTEGETWFQGLQVLSPTRFMKVTSAFSGMRVTEQWARNLLSQAVLSHYADHQEELDVDGVRLELRKVLFRTKKIKSVFDMGGGGQTLSKNATEETKLVREHLNEFYAAVDEDRQRIHTEIRSCEADCAELHRRLQRINPEAARELEVELGGRLGELGKAVVAASQPSANPDPTGVLPNPMSAMPNMSQSVLGHAAASPRLQGRTRALLVGINYFNTATEMMGCINDVRNVKHLLTEHFGWDPKCIRTLTDDNPGTAPTRANILNALHWLAEDCRAGDSIFFHFSGHGEQSIDPHGIEEDGMNETMCPVDFLHAGMLTDDVVGEIIVKHLPAGARLTAVMDCCHSGTGLDLPYQYTDGGWKEDTNPYHCGADVMLFSACMDSEQSADCTDAAGSAGGAMTTAFCALLRSDGVGLTYPGFMMRLQQLMTQQGFTQQPVLTASQQFRYDRKFSLEDSVPNANHKLGRMIRKKFPPRPRREPGMLMSGAGLGEGELAEPVDINGVVLADEEDKKDMQLLADVDALLNQSAVRRGIGAAITSRSVNNMNGSPEAIADR